MAEKSIRVCGLNFRLGVSSLDVDALRGDGTLIDYSTIRIPGSVVCGVVCQVRAACCPLLPAHLRHKEGHQAFESQILTKAC